MGAAESAMLCGEDCKDACCTAEDMPGLKRGRPQRVQETRAGATGRTQRVLMGRHSGADAARSFRAEQPACPRERMRDRASLRRAHTQTRQGEEVAAAQASYISMQAWHEEQEEAIKELLALGASYDGDVADGSFVITPLPLSEAGMGLCSPLSAVESSPESSQGSPASPLEPSNFEDFLSRDYQAYHTKDSTFAPVRVMNQGASGGRLIYSLRETEDGSEDEVGASSSATA